MLKTKFQMEKYLFLTGCSLVKNPESFLREMPLCEMYVGQNYTTRIELLNCITDEIYITSLLHFGIVMTDFVGMGYDAPPLASVLKAKSKDVEFLKERRELFEQMYPGRLDKVEKVFFLGDGNYDDCIRGIFPDKEVVICMKKKLSIGLQRSLMLKLISNIKGSDDLNTHKKRYYEYNGWLFEYQRATCNLYKKEGDKYFEIDAFSGDTNFIKKFRELTGNLSTQEYCELTGVHPKRWELTHPTIERYFKNILHLEPISVEGSKMIKLDYFNDNIFDQRFIDVLKEVKK